MFHRYVYVHLLFSVVLLLFLDGCGSRGLPVSDAPKGTIYCYPRVGVEVKSDFVINRKDDGETQRYYRKKTISLLQRSGYFLGVSDQKREYMILVDYRQYQHHFFSSLLEEALTGWIPFSNLKKEVTYVLVIKIEKNGKAMERYRYEKSFKDTRGAIIRLGEKFFDASMKIFLEKIAAGSRMKRIGILE